MEKFEHEVAPKNKSFANKLANQIRGFESKLEKIHAQILDTLKGVKAEGLEINIKKREREKGL